MNVGSYPVGFIDGEKLRLRFGFVGRISIGMPFHDQRFVSFTNL